MNIEYERIRKELLGAYVASGQERSFEYTHADTGRCFQIRLCDANDEPEEAAVKVHLGEFVPNGRMVELNAKGEPERFCDEPLIKTTIAEVGPNGLYNTLRQAGIAIEGMIRFGAGFSADSIYYDTLDQCAAAIVASLEANTWYHAYRQLTARERRKLREQDKAMREDYHAKRRTVALAAMSWESEGALRGCHTDFGPLSDSIKETILEYLKAPSHEQWLEIRGYCVVGASTLWQLWCAHDARAPRAGNHGHPDRDTLQRAISAGVEANIKELDVRIPERQSASLSAVH